MQPLEKTLRNQLERTIKEARDTAEAAARAALAQLGVAAATPFAHLSEAERELRRKLRVHGRQLGDLRDPVTETQEIFRLLEEVAYEHWHRMLFARFLAENNLLMYPDPDDPVAVTLEECDDLAVDEGAANGWELAARFAARMLPQIFRLDSPVLQLTLPPEHQQKLEQLIAAQPLEVFTASDSLGWVYQFWQAKKKDEVNASEVKIGARELPAVTQLFTEPYMVSFLLDNSLGAWWVKQSAVGSGQSAVKARDLLQTASTEAELREFFSLTGVPLEYLRFVKTDHCTLTIANSSVFDGEHWMPAGGWFTGWPANLADLKTLDPCCGSGHFLVAAFLMLVPMRIEREKLTSRDAVAAVLRENLYGLELDQRCVELAAFALALTAWKYPGAGGYRILPELHLACSGLSVSLAREEWRQFGLGQKNLAIALGWLYDTFKDAPVLGSLLNPANSDATRLVEWAELSGSLTSALQGQAPRAVDNPGLAAENIFLNVVSSGVQKEEQQEVAVVAQGLAKAATLLTGQYQWVITNVPYLTRGKQSDRLRQFCEKHYPEAKNDLATVFLERCLELCETGGTSSIVLPQNWLFLTSYKKFREKLLKHDTWHLIARLGPGAFATISGEVVKAILITLSRGNTAGGHGELFAETQDHNLIRGVDVSEPRTAADKAAGLQAAEIKTVEQAKQLENPDARVALEDSQGSVLLESFSVALHGVSTCDNPRFRLMFWELVSLDDGWCWFQSGSDLVQLYGGCKSVVWLSKLTELYEAARETVYAENDFQEHRAASNESGVYLRGQAAWSNKGVAVRQMRNLPATLTHATPFDTNTAIILPNDKNHLSAIWCFCAAPEYNEVVRRIDQKLNVTNATLVKVPFDLDYWTKVAAERYPNGLPQPYTDDPTQWIFHGHPCGSVVWDEDKKWTSQGPLRTGDTVLQVAIIRLLGYRWPAELDGGMELADEQREWVNRCDTLLPYADDDGIVCIPPVRGEAAASDRLLNLLAAAFNQNGGDTWSNNTLAQLLKNADHAGKTLETWLREKFFPQHCKLFGHRPFIWHIWDGLRDGFAALVNYHKLDKKLLEALIYTYLGDWISRQQQDIAGGVDGAQERLAAAESLKKKLELILIGDAPYDIFVRWKPLAEQSLGWEPDLNDGVRLNIRPFLTVPAVGKKGAGVLRDKPNIKWTKDRGKDVESAPWYHLGSTYGGKEGDRISDHHLTLAEKRTARENVL